MSANSDVPIYVKRFLQVQSIGAGKGVLSILGKVSWNGLQRTCQLHDFKLDLKVVEISCEVFYKTFGIASAVKLAV